MTICFVTQEYPPETNWGGIGTYYYGLSNYLAECGHEVVVLSRAINGQASIKKEASGVTIYRIPPFFNFGKKRFIWRLLKFWDGYQLGIFFKLREIIKKHQIEIIEHPGLHGETFFFQLFCKRKALVITRLHAATRHELSNAKIKRTIPIRISQFFEKKSIEKSTGISSVSRVNLEKNLYQIPQKNNIPIKVIPNPIELNLFNKDRAKLPENLTREIFILFVGRLQVNKGAHILGLCLNEVFSKYPKLKVVFIGKDNCGPEGYSSMISYIREVVSKKWRNNLIFIGQVARNDIISYYQSCQLVVFPSLWETFGYIPLEAMASGKAIIASRSGGPEEIIEDGKEGILIPTNDVHALSKAILTLLKNPAVCQLMGEAGLKKVKEKYEISTIVQEVISFYKEVSSFYQKSKRLF